MRLTHPQVTYSESRSWIISSSWSAGRSCDLLPVNRIWQRWWNGHPLLWLYKFRKTPSQQAGERVSCWLWRRKLPGCEEATWQGTAGTRWAERNPRMAVSMKTGTSVLQPQELNSANSHVSLEEQPKLQKRTQPADTFYPCETPRSGPW